METEAPTATFFNYLDDGRFMLQRGRQSGNYFYPPRAVEPVTGSTDYEWVEVSGKGTVYANTTIRQKPPTPNHNLSLIDLDEGPRMMSRVEGIDAGDVRIGMKVKARIVREGDNLIVVFDPAE